MRWAKRVQGLDSFAAPYPQASACVTAGPRYLTRRWRPWVWPLAWLPLRRRDRRVEVALSTVSASVGRVRCEVVLRGRRFVVGPAENADVRYEAERCLQRGPAASCSNSIEREGSV